MEEFLRQNYILITHGVEITAAIAGIIFYKKYKRTSAKYFIYFLIYVVIIEHLASYPRYVAEYDFLKDIKDYLKGTKFQRNYWFYTLFWNIASAIFYTWYFKANIKNNLFKTILKYGLLLFIFSSTVYLINNWDWFFANMAVFINVTGALLILLSVCLYFLEILRSNFILRFHRSLNFYVAGVLIIWFLITTPLSFYNMYYSTADWIFIFLKWQIFLFANIFMYLTFTFALIFCESQDD